VEELATTIRPTLTWNEANGGLDLRYSVEGAPVTAATSIQLFWASGPNSGSRLGASLSSVNVAAGTGLGSYGPIHINGNLLTGDPARVTHLIAVAGSEVGSIVDARVLFQPMVDSAAVSAGLLDLLRDAARVAGKQSVRVTSSARTPEGQAHAMFQNLTKSANTLAQNIAIQRDIYAAPGDQVIGVFESLSAGRTRAEVIAASSSIIAAMTNTINAVGPGNVSKHCADPALISVVDVGIGSSGFTAASGARFRSYAATRATKVLTENEVYHVELAR